MSGHSKWSTIKRKKGANDAARAKVFTKIGRELSVAVKNGGADPSINTKLKDVIAKAKQNNVPNDNIERMLKKAAGENGGADYEEIIYEGYGPSGVAVVVEALTDNRNRTAGEVRHYFDKAGGNMGTSGSVTFMFTREGVILIEKEDVDEDTLMMDALDAGATDFITDDDDVFEIRTEANDVGAIRDDLENKGYKIISSEPAYIPATYTRLESKEDMQKMSRMIEMFEENDDVQAIWHNCENENAHDEKIIKKSIHFSV
ncbi:MAG: YebC/PmpR family DNA-binding transcriptional regulator [Clostridiales bacterium]|nr:YebC/PmpR family DNA-binding transcriptional regulator [Clostridiales bacterium]